MLVLDANLWVAAYDREDALHAPSVALFAVLAERNEPIAVPSFALLETACAVARRTNDPESGERARAKMAEHPALRVESVDDRLLAEAAALGVARRLRAADAIYVATAERLGCPLLSWDRELLERGAAVSPSRWLSANG